MIKIKFDLQLLDAIKNVVWKPKTDISDQSFIKIVKEIFKRRTNRFPLCFSAKFVQTLFSCNSHNVLVVCTVCVLKMLWKSISLISFLSSTSKM